MHGGFVASPYDKTLPIQVHETWPGVPRLSCLGLWTGDQEPRPTFPPSVLHELNLRWTVLLGPRSVDQRQGLLCLIAKVEPYDLGTGTPNFKAPRLGPRALSISVVDPFGGGFVW